MRTTWRDHLLMLVSTFAATNVLHLIQHNKYALSMGVWRFLAALFVNFVLIFLLCAVVAYIIDFLCKGDDLLKAVRYVFATALVFSLVIYAVYLMQGNTWADNRDHNIWGSSPAPKNLASHL